VRWFYGRYEFPPLFPPIARELVCDHMAVGHARAFRQTNKQTRLRTGSTSARACMWLAHVARTRKTSCIERAMDISVKS
jgi:hypothetical protein